MNDELPEVSSPLQKAVEALRASTPPVDAARLGRLADRIGGSLAGAGAGAGAGAAVSTALASKAGALVVAGAVVLGGVGGYAVRSFSPPVLVPPPVVIFAPPVVVAPLPAPPAAPPAPPASPPPLPERKVEPSRDVQLAAEQRLLDQARAALAKKEATAALETLDRHARQFPRGQLAEEREALSIQALVQQGQVEAARARLDALERAHPNSLFAPALERTLRGH